MTLPPIDDADGARVRHWSRPPLTKWVDGRMVVDREALYDRHMERRLLLSGSPELRDALTMQVATTDEVIVLYREELKMRDEDDTRSHSEIFRDVVDEMRSFGRLDGVISREVSPDSPAAWYAALDEPAQSLVQEAKLGGSLLVGLWNQPEEVVGPNEVTDLADFLARLPFARAVSDVKPLADRPDLFALRAAVFTNVNGAGTGSAIDAPGADPVYGSGFVGLTKGALRLAYSVADWDLRLREIEPPERPQPQHTPPNLYNALG